MFPQKKLARKGLNNLHNQCTNNQIHQIRWIKYKYKYMVWNLIKYKYKYK